MQVDTSLGGVFEAPELVPDDDRPEAAARAIDETLPYRVAYEVGPSAQGAPLIAHVTDRERWLRAAAASGKIPLLSTAEGEPPIAFSAQTLSADFSPYRIATIRAILELPPGDAFIASTGRVVARVGRALRAFWGMATPQPARTILARQHVHPGQKRVPPLGLPVLPGGIALASTAVPHELGWINYWPAPTAALLHFPDRARDAEWLRHATELDDGAWLVQLTADPLDLDRADHLDAVKRAYDRFAEIGRLTAK